MMVVGQWSHELPCFVQRHQAPTVAGSFKVVMYAQGIQELWYEQHLQEFSNKVKQNGTDGAMSNFLGVIQLFYTTH